MHVSSKCIEKGSPDFRSPRITVVKYGDKPSLMIYDALVQLKLKLAVILLLQSTALNKSPIWSLDHNLYLLHAAFVSQYISASRLASP